MEQPTHVSITRQREETVERLRVAAHEAEQNVVRMSRRKKYDNAQYYAGRRDGLRYAIDMLEHGLM